MKTVDLPLKGVKLLSLPAFFDERGFFKEMYHELHYPILGLAEKFVQDNYSFSHHRVLRGMHFQSPSHQAKLISVLQGKIFDVFVDLRTDSPTFGQWQGLYLDSTLHEQLFIPGGFAHGFCVVCKEGAHVHYKVTSLYNPVQEKRFRYDDPTLQIEWPISDPIVSSQDRKAPSFIEVLQ